MRESRFMPARMRRHHELHAAVKSKTAEKYSARTDLTGFEKSFKWDFPHFRICAYNRLQ